MVDTDSHAVQHLRSGIDEVPFRSIVRIDAEFVVWLKTQRMERLRNRHRLGEDI